MKRFLRYSFLLLPGLFAVACTAPPRQSNETVRPSESPTPVVSPSPIEKKNTTDGSLTLPVLDAFFAEESFSASLKDRLQLSDEQITKLKELARTETAKLNEANSGNSDGEGAAARATAIEKISALIGSEKTTQLAALVRAGWNAAENNADKAGPDSKDRANPAESLARAPNAVPTDSRIVVNAPAYRMDVFENGRLIKSYKISIGYPQFPLPTGLRQARVIIFNPTWTPPDEPWVARMNLEVGKRIEAGSKLNPLGPIKIPIGAPSLIHGGKPPSKLGTFGSHGCVGLTTPQVGDFAKLLARLGGLHLSDADLKQYARDRTQTKTMTLPNPIPVELRYETIVATDGKLHIYRDVYDHDTNTEANLRSVLEGQGIKLEDLSEAERTQALEAVKQMAPATKSRKPALSKTKRSTANQKESVIEIAALRGRGYPE